MNPGIPPRLNASSQPVWRAERPQRSLSGIHQCDVDTIGTESPVADTECVAVVHDALTALGSRLHHPPESPSDFTGAAEAIDAVDQETSMLQAIDKLDRSVEMVKERQNADSHHIDFRTMALSRWCTHSWNRRIENNLEYGYCRISVYITSACTSIEPSHAASTTTPVPFSRRF